MLITLNQKEIETMILRGLTDMGIPHDNATINMVAGRSPNGITAEVKLSPSAKIATTINVPDTRETFSGDREHPALEATDGVKGDVGDNHSDNTGDGGKDDPEDPSDPEDDTSLFDK